MTEFGCSVCEYTSSNKINVIRHINRKKSCGPGIKEIIEFCNKRFSCITSLKYHMKNNCKHKDTIKDTKIKELEEKVKELERRPTTNITQNITNNIIIVNNYENTSLDKLTDKTYNKIIKDAEEAYKIIPNLIKHIHFNPKIPENHNIYLSNRNKNNKHLQIYKDKHWEIVNKDSEIDNLINDKETILSDWVSEKGEKYPESAEKFNEYLDQKDDSAKLIKEEVELELYNNKHLIKN